MANWQTKLDLTAVWPKDDPTPDVRTISAEIVKQLRALDLSFLADDDPYRQMAVEYAEELEDLAQQDEPDVEDFDDLMDALYDWADESVPAGTGMSGRKKICWIATL